MAMSGVNLGAAIKAAIDTLTGDDRYDRDDLFRKMGEAIVTYITSNAIVTVTSVSGVTTGVGASGPGTGSIS